MSGNRSIHRENLGPFPIWQVVCSPSLRRGSSTSAGNIHQGASWRIWTACGDGRVRGYLVQEKTLDMQRDVLDASACSCILTHTLGGTENDNQQDDQSPKEMLAIGCSQVQVARNYVGDDELAGDLLVVSLNMAGRIRIWVLPEDMDQQVDFSSSADESRAQSSILAKEFVVENATGTCLKICPPKVFGVGDVVIAVPCLDGTIATIATGISTPKSTKAPTEAGSIIDRWSKAGSPIALSGDWHPSKKSLAVGRDDGLVEILGVRSHRLIQHEAPVRAVAFTPDGHLLATASDDGMLSLWDTSRTIPALVNHVVRAHDSWIFSLTTLWDSRRFASCGADGKIHIWSAGEMDQALHSFTSDDIVWTIQAQNGDPQRHGKAAQMPPRLTTGSENGRIHIYSLET